MGWACSTHHVGGNVAGA